MDRHGRYRRWIPAAILVVGLACTAAASWLSWRAQSQKERDRFAGSAMEMRAEIAERLAECIAVLRVTGGLFAASEHVTALEFQHFVERLELGAAYPGVVGIGYSEHLGDVDNDGRDRHSITYLEPLTEENRSAIGHDLSTEPRRRAAMERARDTGEPSASGPVVLSHINPGNDQPGFLIFVALYAGGELPATTDERRERLQGFVYAAFLPQQLVAAIFRAAPAPAEFALYDGAPDSGALIFCSDGMQPAAKTLATWTSPLDVAGRTWTMVATPAPAFFQGRARGLAPLVGGMGALLSVILFWLARVQTRAADRFEGIAEALRRSEARKGAILESAMDAVITMDSHGRVVEWNRAAEVVFGRSREQTIGKDAALLILGADSDAARRFREVLSPDERSASRRVEMTAQRADGSEFPVEASISRIGTTAADGFTGFFRDITERARAGRRGALLMRELDHRVKNNLSTVIAILGETARRCESVPDLVRRASGRIRALAGLHEMLAAQRWEGAEVSELVSRTIAPYQTEGRILVTGQPTRIPGRAASALCMALHELATNAAKYGSLSSSSGRAEVSWTRTERSPGDESILLTWRESGGPPVGPPAQRGFGTELIENGIAFETGGRSKIEFAPAGLVCVMEIPLREEMDPVEPIERRL